MKFINKIAFSMALLISTILSASSTLPPKGFEGLPREYYAPYTASKVNPEFLRNLRTALGNLNPEREGLDWTLGRYYNVLGLSEEQLVNLGRQALSLNPEQRLRMRILLDELIRRKYFLPPHEFYRHPNISPVLVEFYKVFEPTALYPQGNPASWNTLHLKSPEARWVTYKYLDAIQKYETKEHLTSTVPADFQSKVTPAKTPPIPGRVSGPGLVRRNIPSKPVIPPTLPRRPSSIPSSSSQKLTLPRSVARLPKTAATPPAPIRKTAQQEYQEAAHQLKQQVQLITQQLQKTIKGQNMATLITLTKKIQDYLKKLPETQRKREKDELKKWLNSQQQWLAAVINAL